VQARHFSKQADKERQPHSGYIDFKSIKYPVVNPVAIMAVQKHNNQYMKIQNYLYPAKEGVRRKGIVYFVHGYGEYNGRCAYLGKGFSEAGYDFAGID
jgi:hypothetical protein